jgi:hypothetical protein
MSVGRGLARDRSSQAAIACLAVALTGALILFHRTWAHPTSYSVGNGNGTGADPLQFMWYLRWVPWSLAHGHNPFVTDRIYFPGTTSLAWNTPVPVLGILGAPLNLVGGPVLTYNVLLTASPVLTALAARYWLRRYAATPGAAEVGGLVFAFGPFFAGHLQGHLNMAFFGLVPLILAWADDLLRGSAANRRRTATLLAVAAAAQLGISEELMLITILGALIAVAGCAVCRPRPTVAALRSSAPSFGCAIIGCAVLASPLLINQLLLSEHLEVAADGWTGILGDVVVPTDRVVNPFGFASVLRPELNDFEVTGYVGYPMLSLVAAAVLRSAADWRIRVAVVVGIAGIVLSLGAGNSTTGPLPWHFLQEVPFLVSVLPVRLTLLTQLALAFIVAITLDRILALPRRLVRLVLALLVASCALSLLPEPLPASRVSQPAFFRGPMSGIPVDSAILVLPMAEPLADQALLWQAEANFRFKMYGGYALHLDDNGNTLYGPVDTPLVSAVASVKQTGEVRAQDVAAVRDALQSDRATAIVVVQGASGYAGYEALAAQTAGRPPDRRDGGVDLWLLNTG